MPWRSTLAAVATVALVATGCGDDTREATLSDIAVYDFDGTPEVITHEGRPMVVNFFAESCAPCVAEMPAFESVFQRLSGGVDFVGISEDATAAAARRIIETTGISYRATWDADGTAFAQFEALGLPTTVFITEAGEIVDVHTGALSAEGLSTMIAELLER